MKDQENIAISGYRYMNGAANPSHLYLLPTVLSVLASFELPSADKRIFDVGCGNGSVASESHVMVGM